MSVFPTSESIILPKQDPLLPDTAKQSSQIVLISGGNAGIGYETVKKLGLENPSYHIIMGCRNLSSGQTACSTLPASVSVSPIELEITSDESIAACVSFISSTYGRLDVLINNAGILGLGSTVRERFTNALSVIAISAACLTDAFLPLLSKSDCPRIVFVSSSLGSLTRSSQAYTKRPMAYRASKAAMNMIGLCYARELEKDGFLVNVCDPGVNGTGLARQAGANEEYIKNMPHASGGAINAVRLATLEKGGVTGTYSSKEGELPW
ncbi:hypothetical protein MMC20_000087 [Loxospora ochrophaea]|nr:hypothetical protein [Loxospora ochrophaea]